MKPTPAIIPPHLTLHTANGEEASLNALFSNLPNQTPWRGRLAPTPSGYLHRGNIMNFLLNWLVLRISGGEVGLRIDDMDPTRSRPEYIEAIFTTLDWLGLDWDFGPQTVAEQKKFSFQTEQAGLQTLAESLLEKGLAYACDCTRKQLQGQGPTYPGHCRNLNKPWQPGINTLRLAAYKLAHPQNWPQKTQQAGLSARLPNMPPVDDTVIWSRDNYASYQLASVWRDEHDRISLLIRGADLLDSSRFQNVLAQALQLKHYPQTAVWHHPLLTDDHGHKLAKSTGSQAHPLPESGLHPAELIRQFAGWIGLPEHSVALLGTLHDLRHALEDSLP
ncbi:glutamate--tRNA ligase family protein [Thiomicrorhabdus cannonii]|uniref:glutamate--tRNA ligase family protein n=1 Tax=Thiomicrorhabdus cannonii TaxID=2748011 RepID=UPI0015BA8421|nr:glutamate--tRNA ligase family protein [Thiomicrorhabdus cannonii]